MGYMRPYVNKTKQGKQIQLIAPVSAEVAGAVCNQPTPVDFENIPPLACDRLI